MVSDKLSRESIYPTSLVFDRAAVVRGIEALNLLGNRLDRETVAHDFYVVGQIGVKGDEVVGDRTLRATVIYRHKPTDLLGAYTVDIKAELVRDLELAGTVVEADALEPVGAI